MKRDDPIAKVVLRCASHNRAVTFCFGKIIHSMGDGSTCVSHHFLKHDGGIISRLELLDLLNNQRS